MALNSYTFCMNIQAMNCRPMWIINLLMPRKCQTEVFPVDDSEVTLWKIKF